jgi:hypothetical protein
MNRDTGTAPEHPTLSFSWWWEYWMTKSPSHVILVDNSQTPRTLEAALVLILCAPMRDLRHGGLKLEGIRQRLMPDDNSLLALVQWSSGQGHSIQTPCTGGAAQSQPPVLLSESAQ